MKEGVRLTFKGIPQEKRRKILKTLTALGLTEINSQHDTHNDRHSYEMYLDDLDISELIMIEDLEENNFKVEEGIGC